MQPTKQRLSVNDLLPVDVVNMHQMTSKEPRINFIRYSADHLKDAIAHRILLHLLKFLVFFAFQSDSPYSKNSDYE